MEYHFDCKVELHKEEEFPGLYAWYLSEKDNKGSSNADKLCPWNWSFYFESVELSVRTTIEKTHEGIVSRKECRAKLVCTDAVNFSMFGTKRKINSVALSIHPNDEGEYCSAFGIVSYTAETDFRNHTEEDYLGFSVFLNSANFDSLVATLEAGAKNLLFQVGAIDGFYSEWSPSISTNQVKVLPAGSENKITSFMSGIEPPRLGTVGEWRLSLNNQILSIVQSQKQDANIVSNGETDGLQLNPNESLRHFDKHLKSVLIPLWAIALLLFLMLVFGKG